MPEVLRQRPAILRAALDQALVESPRLGRGCDIVIEELAPLHHHQGELLRVGARVPEMG